MLAIHRACSATALYCSLRLHVKLFHCDRRAPAKGNQPDNDVVPQAVVLRIVMYLTQQDEWRISQDPVKVRRRNKVLGTHIPNTADERVIVCACLRLATHTKNKYQYKQYVA